MKKGLVILCLLVTTGFASAQVTFSEYRNGARMVVDGTTYLVDNPYDDMMSVTAVQQKGVSICLQDITNSRIDKIGQYVDGSYAQSSEEVRGIIQGRESNDDIVYSAVRKAFSKEELSRFRNNVMWVFVVADHQGVILETASVIHIRADYVIQPSQIHALESYLKQNLRFTLNEEKAARFRWFEGQIMIRFKDYSRIGTFRALFASHVREDC